MANPHATRAERYDAVQRRIRVARTHLRNAVGLGMQQLRADDLPLPTDYWDLLDTALAAAFDILEALPDDFFETQPSWDILGLGVRTFNSSDSPLDTITALRALIDDRRERGEMVRKIGLLEDEAGRTPEEIEMFRAKAAELRERYGIAP